MTAHNTSSPPSPSQRPPPTATTTTTTTTLSNQDNTQPQKTIRIDITSDTTCPWCYIADRRLQKAITTFKTLYAPLSIHFDLHWHPFQLDPNSSKTPILHSRLYTRKFGPERAKQVQTRILQAGKAEGIGFKFFDEQGQLCRLEDFQMNGVVEGSTTTTSCSGSSSSSSSDGGASLVGVGSMEVEQESMVEAPREGCAAGGGGGSVCSSTFTLIPPADSTTEPIGRNLLNQDNLATSSAASTAQQQQQQQHQQHQQQKQQGWYCNTLDSHRLIALADQCGGAEKQAQVVEALFQDYFEKGLCGDIDTLVNTGTRVLKGTPILGYIHSALQGLNHSPVEHGEEEQEQEDEAKVKAALWAYLESDHGVQDIKDDIQEARDLGIVGVPSMVIQNMYLLSGAQDPSTFVEIFKRVV